MWLIQHYINRRLVAVSATDSVVLLNMRKIYFLNTLMLCVLLWPSLVLTGALFPTWTLQFADVCTALRTSSPPGVVLQKNKNKTQTKQHMPMFCSVPTNPHTVRHKLQGLPCIGLDQGHACPIYWQIGVCGLQMSRMPLSLCFPRKPFSSFPEPARSQIYYKHLDLQRKTAKRRKTQNWPKLWGGLQLHCWLFTQSLPRQNALYAK